MLISNIDKNLNYIWRVQQKRRAVFSFSMYWMILTLGPILVGASIAATSYITSLKILDNEALSGVYNLFYAGCRLCSLTVPSSVYICWCRIKVHWQHAMLGALIAAILFELSKKALPLILLSFLLIS